MKKKAEPEQMTKEENKFLRNYAADSKVTERWWDLVKGQIMQARWNRREKENLWLDDDKQWACNTDVQAYRGRANLFIPELFHQVEATVSKYVSGILPSDNYIGARAKNGEPEDIVKDIVAAVYDQINNKNHAPALFDKHGRQRTMKGTAPLRPIFRRKEVPVYFKDKRGGVSTKIVTQSFVEWKIIDLYRWYIYPEYATMDDYTLIFEDDWVQKRVLEQAKIGGKPMYVNLDDINEINEEYDDHTWVDLERLAANTIFQAASQRPGGVYVTTVYMDFNIDGGDEWVPCVGYIANNGTVIRLARNQFWFQKAPYVVGRYVTWATNNFYGLSLPDRLRSLCRWQTDTANQTVDSLNYALSPIAVIDPALAGDPSSFVMQPGARWFGSPQGIEFKQMSDVTGTGWQAMQQVRNMISQFSDNSTSVAPQLMGKARSATQASFVDKEVSKDQRVSMLNEEVDVTIPMCHMTHSMLRQFQKEDFQILTQGAEKGQWITKSISPERLEAEVDFEWFGSSVQEKNATRNQQLMSAFQLAIQSAQLPGMQGKVDFPALYQRIMKEAFELDHLEDFMIDVRTAMTVDAETENIALLDEMDLLTHNGDDDDEHIKKHNEALDLAKSNDQKLIILKHLERHKQQAQAKAQLKELEAKQQALQSQMQQGGGPGGGQPQGTQGPMPGNVNQMPENPSEANITRGIRGREGNLH